MRRISTGLTMFALTAGMGCALLPRDSIPASVEVASHKPDFSSVAVDLMPVGTAKQMARAKRIRANRKT